MTEMQQSLETNKTTTSGKWFARIGLVIGAGVAVSALTVVYYLYNSGYRRGKFKQGAIGPIKLQSLLGSGTGEASNDDNKSLYVIVLSGKKCSGKDLASEILAERLKEKQGLKVVITGFGIVCKKEFAKEFNLSVEKLLSSSPSDRPYKEQHRERLTEFFHVKIAQDPDYFANQIRKYLENDVPKGTDVVIVKDVSRIRHLEIVQRCQVTRCISIRIEASDESRMKRGWSKAESDQDCVDTELDDYPAWNFTVQNDSPTPEAFTHALSSLDLPLH
jgi:phosphomevalonate kinase